MAKKAKKGTRGARSRRGKSEDMTGAKEATVEVRTAQSELKLPPLEKQLFYYDSLKAEQAKMDTIKSRIQTLNKNAKSDGVDMKSIKDTMAMERGDQIEWRQRLEQQARLMREKGISFQLSVFDTAYGSEVEQAAAEARAQASAGKAFECRFPEGSEAHTAASKEWMRINAERVPGGQDLSDDDIEDAISLPTQGGGGAQLEMH